MDFAYFLSLLASIMRAIFYRKKIYKTYYSVCQKSAAKLTPEDIMGQWRSRKEFGFREYYYSIKEVDLIRAMIENDKHVLIIGDSLSGKTRAAYEALKSLTGEYDILVPNPIAVKDIKNLLIPGRLLFRNKCIVFFDDISDFAKYEYLPLLIDKFNRRKSIIVATCRLGTEFNTLRSRLFHDFSSIFKEPIEIGKITDDMARAVAENVGKKITRSFDGNIGSILLPLDFKQNQYNKLSENEKAILRSIKRLYFAGVFEEKKAFREDRVRLVCSEIENMTCDGIQWIEWLSKIINSLFIKKVNENIFIEEAYLEKVIPDNISILDNFETISDIFISDNDAMLWAANHASEIGLLGSNGSNYLEFSIRKYITLLERLQPGKSPTHYGIVNFNLANTYRKLAYYKDPILNCDKAIFAYKDALVVRNTVKKSKEYYRTLGNLGAVYALKGDFKMDKEWYLKACECFIELLEGGFGLYDAPALNMTEYNLANVYGKLAEFQDPVSNCNKAIELIRKVIKVRQNDKNLLDFASAKMSLGAVLRTLALHQNTRKNCQKSLAELNDALEIFNKEKSTLGCGYCHYNMALTYYSLYKLDRSSEFKTNSINSIKCAIEIYNNIQSESYLEMAKIVLQKIEST